MKHQIVCMSIILFSLMGCSKPEITDTSGDSLRHVKTMLIESSQQKRFIELPGVVAADKEAELSFRIAGKVKELPVKEGDHVKAGQMLAVLEDTDFQIRLKSDEAEYARARADFERGKVLVVSGTISQADYSQLDSTLAAAEASLKSTKQNIVYSTLRAPFDGVIAKRSIESYEEVQAKQVILVLQDVTTIDIKVDIPERIMIRTNSATRPNVEAIFDAISNKSFPLSYKEVATRADRDTNTYEVTMSMPRVEGYNILPGMSVTTRAAQLVGDAKSKSVYVPAHSVLEDTTGRYAFIAMKQSDKKGTVERRDLVTGSLSSLGLEVVSGLEEGDYLVVAGMSKMYEGLEVLIEQE